MLKKLIYTTLFILMLFSCDDMNSVHKKYVKNGERIYLAKPMEVKVLAGKNRVAFDFKIINPTTEKYCTVSSPDGTEIFKVEIDSKVDTFKVYRILDNLKEGTYQFYLQTFDGKGNTSIKETAFGKAYGEYYQSTLQNVSVKEVSAEGATATKIKLANTNSDISGYELKFTRQGETAETYLKVNDVKKLSWNDDASFTIESTLSQEGGLKWRAAYLPEKVAVDTFYTAWAEWGRLIVGALSSTGTFSLPVGEVRSFTRDKVALAIGDATFETELADLGDNGYTIRIKINADNSVTVAQYLNGNPLPNSEMVPGAENSYNPSTQTFTLNYRYSGDGGYRTISETVVRK